MHQEAIPILAQWDITEGCNFTCSFCLTNSGKRAKDELCFDEAKIIVDRLYDDGVLFLRVLGGEPFFRNDIINVLHYAAQKGMMISFSTNASLINHETAKSLKAIEESFNYFQISLYGVDSESYEKCTNNSNGFKLVNEGLENLRKAGLRPYAFWVLNQDNLKYIEKAYQLVKGWGLPALRISPQLNLGRASKDFDINLNEENTYWREVVQKLKKINAQVEKDKGATIQLHARPMLGEYFFEKTGVQYFYITCKAASTMVYVDCKGNASPCPFAGFMPKSYNSSSELKEKISLLDNSLKEIWDSEIFREYRALQNPSTNPKEFNTSCPHYKSGMCEPCIFTPCTCKDAIKMINASLRTQKYFSAL